ncbi:metal-dependent hydrolase [Brevibacterium sp.]|uniref:metal-dependent hydrolase n=1 Tax=Brevibacterium sp. TaxID=1701 RepID=UPI0025B98DBA|nr:metal-dependent hydrolase [Brevibacterium sp.]
MTDSTAVFHSGDVYSSVDPFATALAFSGPLVSWVGEDEAARTMPGEQIDLDGDFLTPGFVHAGLLLDGSGPAADPEALLAAGITTVHALGTPEALSAFAEAAPAALSVLAHPFADAGTRRAVRAAELTSALGAEDGTSLYVVADTGEELDAVLAALADPQTRTRAQRGLWRVLVRCGIEERHIAPLAAAGVGITLDPAARAQPLAPLMSAGAQLSFALDAVDAQGRPQPWETLAAAVFRTEAGISARAAFNAATRFGFRAVGSFEGGVLAPGAEATAVRWRTGELVVQVADARLAAWSTDPRSGTAGLPDLSGESPLPVPRGVWVRGVRV